MPTLSQLCSEYLKRNGQLLIVVSGLSGAGKTYQAQRLAKLLKLTHIDQDRFYKSCNQMPDITFSNGIEMKNWDCLESLDFKRQNQMIDRHVRQGVIFSGFACRQHVFEHHIDLHIHLQITPSTCYERRQYQGKDDPELGQLIIDELVYPFYVETLKSSRIDHIIDANEMSKQTGIEMIKYISDLLSEKKSVMN